jgi:hypothetical protein
MPSTILLEPPVECPTVELPWVRSFLAACRFKAATQGDLGGRPVTESPHSYCPRRSLSDSKRLEFDRFAALIDEHGFRGRFLSVVYTYLIVPGGDRSIWRYWISDAWFPPTLRGMINRADQARSPMLPVGSTEPTPPPPPQLQMEI